MLVRRSLRLNGGNEQQCRAKNEEEMRYQSNERNRGKSKESAMHENHLSRDMATSKERLTRLGKLGSLHYV